MGGAERNPSTFSRWTIDLYIVMTDLNINAPRL